MAYLFYKYSKKSHGEKRQNELLSRLNQINPNESSSPISDYNDHEIIYQSDPSEFIFREGFSMVSGAFSDLNSNWWNMEAELPENFTFLLRSNSNKVSVFSDTLASRTIWYYCDENELVVSTSQFMIISVLSDFQCNDQAISWMISTGTTGPGISWDIRIQAMPPNGHFQYDKLNGTHNMSCELFEFSDKLESDDNLSTELNEKLDDIFRRANFSARSFLTLSGGMDSRVVASLTSKYHKNKDIRSFTWGLESKKSLKKGDVYLAKQVATNLNIQNTFLDIHTDRCSLNFEDFLSLYISLSEARVDHYTGYLDGF